jgi:phosphoribosylformylglycinamidine (FGAM) synthase PurS component
MMFEVELFIKLKTTDLIAQTARSTLKQDMGYERMLQEIEREDYWLIDVLAESEGEARRLGEEFVRKTKIFVNPNKHEYRIRIIKKGERKKIDGKQDGFKIRVLVSYLEDGKAELAKHVLQTTMGYGERIQGVKRGDLWTLVVNAESEEEAKEVAREITITKSIDKGLLANPLSQFFEIY